MIIKKLFNFCKSSAVDLLFVALIIITALSIYTTLLFPIYPDEIQVRFWLSRLPYDFPEKISGAPPCLASFFQPTPITMFVPGVIDWIIHGRISSLFSLRLVGMAIGFLWICALILYIFQSKNNKIVQENINRNCKYSRYVLAFFISIFSIGVLPFFLVTNRGEQLILPAVTVLAGISVFSKNKGMLSRNWSQIYLAILYFIFISLALFAHPKAIFLTPFFVIVGWQLFGLYKSRWPFVCAIVLLGYCVVINIGVFKYSFICNELPKFQKDLNSYSFDPLSLFYAPAKFFEQASSSIQRFPKYLKQLGFQQVTDISYLPDLQLGVMAKLANIFINFNVGIAFCSLVLILPYYYFRNDFIRNKYFGVNFTLTVLLACTVISAIFNIPKHWYDAGYIYSLFIIVIIFFIGENFPGLFSDRLPRKFILYLVAVSLLSQIAFVGRYLGPFRNGYAGPSISLAKYHASTVNQHIKLVSEVCGVDPVNSKAVIVDDNTYMYFQKSRWPMAVTYIRLIEIEDKSLTDFIEKTDSDGLVVKCSSLISPDISPVRREGDYCCITKNDLKSISSLP